MRPRQPVSIATTTVQRVRAWYMLIVIICSIFLLRLFYLQIIKHDFYQKAAQRGQLKEYEIPASRGIIEAYDGDTIIPLVLNEKRYTLFADPKYIKDPKSEAKAIATQFGGDVRQYEQKMSSDTRYAILAKKLTKEQKEKIDALKLKGVGTREEEYRTYPQGALGAQLLGFVNDENEGKYGIEQYLNAKLKGEPGSLRAITDARGIPLVANKDNILVKPKSGQRTVLTLDIPLQKRLEDILKTGLENAKSTSGSALILDVRNGAVKAMANYPSYNPAEFATVTDANVFNNATVASPLEVGSVMKPLTAAAALNQGVVSKNTTYYDPSRFVVDGATVRNIEEDGGAGTRSITDILQLSLNTGAVWLLMQMGGGEINQQARTVWHDYMTNRYQFGKQTGIEQGYEADGFIPDPSDGFGLGIQYANTAFGQGMTATPLQMGAALAAIVNGGNYYRPHLVESMGADGASKTGEQLLRPGVVSGETGSTIQHMMEYVVEKNNRPAIRPGYSVGGKTGTAQVPKPGGGYYDDRYNGMYLGFVGGDKPEYVIVVRVNEPHIAGYAGAQAAAPIFASLSNSLINNFGITPKTQ